MMDDDLERLSRAQLIDEVKRLRAGRSPYRRARLATVPARLHPVSAVARRAGARGTPGQRGMARMSRPTFPLSPPLALCAPAEFGGKWLP